MDSRQERIEALVVAFPFLAELMAAHESGHLTSASNSFLVDIVKKLQRDGRLTPRQISGAEHSFHGWQRYESMRDESIRVEASLVAHGVVQEPPEGRHTIRGKILSLTPKEDNLSYFGGKVIKAMVRVIPEGYRVWMTVPADLVGEVKRGDHIEADVTLVKSSKDKYFALGRLPRKARRLSSL